MRLSEMVTLLEEIAPPELAYESDQDRIGLVLDRGNNVNKVAVALDVTDYVLEEAAREEVDLLVTHHTPIYHPIHRISKSLSDSLKIALENEISIYVMHTNYDRAEGGVNDVLADILELWDVQELEPGRIGRTGRSKTSEFAQFVARKLNVSVRWTGEREIETVMVIGGSGLSGEFVDIAIEGGADVLVSGEMRHDAIRKAHNLALIDATHYATEIPAMRRLCDRLPVDTVFIDHAPDVNVVDSSRMVHLEQMAWYA
ncbi:Nif3-like dinuclear metal center hexameric protein [ANME-2 cluster archaeon]|nr:MAG: Nif3-like dinuclear metal center hexameric protein [ANME-2 cluster archaeon]RLG24179.1 MAG: Nif3-like dinuclear metal center hexameric protein [Methanosarcinales archaeon]